MSFLLTNAVLLPLAALVLVPLILHLFARARPPVYDFSAVEFLQRVLRKAIRLKKPQSLLVLILRTLLFGAVIGVFLKPVFFGNYRWPGAGVQRNVVVLVDATASMGAVEGTQTRFAAACAKAAEILSELSGADAANLIWMGTPNRAEFPQLSINFGFLKNALRAAAVTSEAADIPAALALAGDLLRGKEGREIFVLSDFQATAWSGAVVEMPRGIRVYAIKVGAKELPNQAVTAITTEPAKPLAGQEVKVFCDLHNFSPEYAMGTVYLRTEQLHETREVRLAPWQKASVVFQVKYKTPGEKTLAVSLSEDAFPYDNERWAVLEVVEHLSLGLFEGEPQTAAYWRRAVDSLGWAKAETVLEARLQQPLNFDALLLAGWPADRASVGPVRLYLERGGTVIWYPHQNTSGTNVAGLLAAPGSRADSPAPWFWEKADTPWRLQVMDREFPAWRIFEGGVYGDPARGLFSGRFRVDPGMLRAGKTVLAFEDGMPALVQFKGKGNLFLWNLPLQREYSDWAAHMEFLPFFGELILHHRSAPPSSSLRDFSPGQPLFQEFEGQVLDGDVRLEHGGQPLRLAAQSSGTRTTFSSTETKAIGLYQWAYRGQPVGGQAVNFPAVESDLRVQRAPALGQTPVVALSAAHSMKQLKDGAALWPMLLAIAVGLALVEGLVLLRVDKR